MEAEQRRKKARKVPPTTLKEFEEFTQTNAHPTAWRYLSYYAGSGLTSRLARNYLDQIRLQPRALKDVSAVDTSVTLCDGTKVPFPVIIAPTAFHRLFHPDGELATARAAATTGTMYSYNIFLAATTIEKIAEDPLARTGPKWLHIYFMKSRSCVKKLVQRGEATGMFTGIIVTCDHPHNRVRDYIKPDFMDYAEDFPFMAENKGLMPNAVEDDGTPFDPEDTLMDAALTWKDLAWLKSITRLPVIAKGILHEEDALLAAKAGASGIVVSNHGGRQIDGAVPAIEVLPYIVASLKKHNINIDVYVDSGIRTGGDIVKALSLGAKAVLLGRPILWGLALGGQPGLERLLTCLKDELTNDMMSLGCASLKEMGPHLFFQEDESRHHLHHQQRKAAL